MNLFLSTQALNELTEAALYYVDQSPQAAVRFDEVVEEALNSIAQMPDVYPRLEDDIQYKVLQQYPFTIYFVQRDREIRVFSIAHHKKMPPPWRG